MDTKYQKTSKCSANRFPNILGLDEKHLDRRRHWNILMGYQDNFNVKHQEESKQLMNQHSSLRPDQDTKAITCQKCKLLFYGRSKVSNYNKHIGATHLKKRPHVCDLCGKAFQYVYKLNRHRESVHLGLKPFHCPDCKKQFSDRSNMTKHVKNKSCVRSNRVVFE